MKVKHLRRADEAIGLTVVLASRLPAGCRVPPEDLFAVLWPIGCRLVRLERRAKRNKAAARAYKKARRDAAELVRTWPDSPVPVAALAHSVPLDATCWRTVLAPGALAHELAGEAA